MQGLSATNSWIAAAARARRRIPAWAAILVTVALFAFTLTAGPLMARALLPPGEAGYPIAATRMLRSLGYYLPLYLVPLLLMRFYEQRDWPSLRPAWAGFGLAAGALSFLAALGLAALSGAVAFVSRERMTAQLILSLVAAAAIIGFRSLAEEVIFRGWLQPLVGRNWGAWAGLIVSAVLFAAVHVLRNFQPMALLNVVLAGLFFGLLAMRTGTLAASFGAHWTWNTLEQCVFGLSPNPGVDRMGSLVDLDLAGPALLSGGADAMNGSIATTIALGLAVLVLANWEKIAARRAAWRLKFERK